MTNFMDSLIEECTISVLSDPYLVAKNFGEYIFQANIYFSNKAEKVENVPVHIIQDVYDADKIIRNDELHGGVIKKDDGSYEIAHIPALKINFEANPLRQK